MMETLDRCDLMGSFQGRIIIQGMDVVSDGEYYNCVWVYVYEAPHTHKSLGRIIP